MHEIYDPMVVVAANRGLVRLYDGRVGRLIWWSTTQDSATFLCDGKHWKILKDEVEEVFADVREDFL
jgi:hypothetical protein